MSEVITVFLIPKEGGSSALSPTSAPAVAFNTVTLTTSSASLWNSYISCIKNQGLGKFPF